MQRTAHPNARRGFSAHAARTTLKRHVATAAAGVLMLAAAGLPITSFAQSCSQLRADLGVAQSRFARTFVDSPGSTIVWGMCSSTGAEEYRRTRDAGAALAKYMTCAGMACLLTDSYGNCLTVQRDLFSVALTAAEAEQRLKGRC
ncbi:MAG: hypothetical protein ACK5X3_18630 [Pseudomonadota bacterium]